MLTSPAYHLPSKPINYFDYVLEFFVMIYFKDLYYVS